MDPWGDSSLSYSLTPPPAPPSHNNPAILEPLTLDDLDVPTPEGLRRHPHGEDALGRLCRALQAQPQLPDELSQSVFDSVRPGGGSLSHSALGSVNREPASLLVTNGPTSHLSKTSYEDVLRTKPQPPPVSPIRRRSSLEATEAAAAPPCASSSSATSSSASVQVIAHKCPADGTVTMDNVSSSFLHHPQSPSAHIGPGGRGFVSTIMASKDSDVQFVNRRGFQPHLNRDRPPPINISSTTSSHSITIEGTSARDRKAITSPPPLLTANGLVEPPPPVDLDLQPPQLHRTTQHTAQHPTSAQQEHPIPSIFTPPDPLPYRLEPPPVVPPPPLHQGPRAKASGGLSAARVDAIVREWMRIDHQMRVLKTGKSVLDLVPKPIKDSTCPVGSVYFRLGNVASDRSLVPADIVFNEATLRHTIEELIMLLSTSQLRERSLSEELYRIRSACHKLRTELNESRARRDSPPIKRRPPDIRVQQVPESVGAVGDSIRQKAFDFTNYLYEEETENDPPVIVRASELENVCRALDGGRRC